jgi:hypothetical protein
MSRETVHPGVHHPCRTPSLQNAIMTVSASEFLRFPHSTSILTQGCTSCVAISRAGMTDMLTWRRIIHTLCLHETWKQNAFAPRCRTLRDDRRVRFIIREPSNTTSSRRVADMNDDKSYRRSVDTHRHHSEEGSRYDEGGFAKRSNRLRKPGTATQRKRGPGQACWPLCRSHPWISPGPRRRRAPRFGRCAGSHQAKRASSGVS